MIKVLKYFFRTLPISYQIKLKKRVSLFYYDAGFGDTLLIAAVAREVKRKYGNKIKVTVNTQKHNLLLNNPNIDTISNRHYGIDLNYHYGKYQAHNSFTENLIEIMCKKVAINNPEHKVDIYLSEKEISAAQKKVSNIKKPFVTIQAISGSFDAGRKLWPIEQWIDLVSKLNNLGITVIQLGSENENYIQGTTNMTHLKEIRESVAIINEASLHIGVVSSFMHAAAATNTDSIILFGGFEKYSAHQYINITPIESNIECAPCGKTNQKILPCPNNNRCMNEIPPEKIIEIVKKKLNLNGVQNG